jgi:hypothetical protein
VYRWPAYLFEERKSKERKRKMEKRKRKEAPAKLANIVKDDVASFPQVKRVIGLKITHILCC